MDFERSIEQGFALDNRQTFAEYADYVLDLKQRTGTKARTLDRYRDLLVRINQAIGHIKLNKIRPQHLNDFYQNISIDDYIIMPNHIHLLINIHENGPSG